MSYGCGPSYPTGPSCPHLPYANFRRVVGRFFQNLIVEKIFSKSVNKINNSHY